MGGISRRIDRARPDMAEAAGHADAIGADQALVVIVGGIRVVALGVPTLAGRFVEGGVWEEAQADDAGGFAEIRADRQRLTACGGVRRASCEEELLRL